jgi:hypothetical protein
MNVEKFAIWDFAKNVQSSIVSLSLAPVERLS